jgi:hypothetical protein
MKIWWVLGWDDYYPGVDNFCSSFLTEDEADAYIEKQKQTRYPEHQRYEVVNISNRL